MTHLLDYGSAPCGSSQTDKEMSACCGCFSLTELGGGMTQVQTGTDFLGRGLAVRICPNSKLLMKLIILTEFNVQMNCNSNPF